MRLELAFKVKSFVYLLLLVEKPSSWYNRGKEGAYCTS